MHKDIITEFPMADTIDPVRRTATAPEAPHAGPVTLINSFVVPEGREAAFIQLWTATSGYFRAQPGFTSLKLHRAVSGTAPYRFVNVARWASAQQFAAAHATSEFRDLVSQPQWREFPSSPALYEVFAEYG
jgi:heme-degrading monooxygenase HmoA